MASLWEYANPVKFIRTTDVVLPWLSGAAAICLVVGLVWGFFFTPDDYRQGATVKIIYLHVPAALMAINAWLMMLVASLIWLVRRHHVSALAARAAAPVGIVMTLIALATGAIWGQPMWGTYWEWDPRLTSELVLLFLFLGYIFLRQALAETRQADRASGILAIVGVVNLPIIHYSVEWWNSIHQGPSLIKLETPSIAGDMLWPLLVMILGYQLLFFAILMTSVRSQVLQREKSARWISEQLGST